VLHVPGADADDKAGDRNYLVLTKPNVIMNDIRLRVLPVTGSDAAGPKSAFSDPSNWVSNTPHPDPTPAIESCATSSRHRHDVEPEETLEAEIVEPEGEPANDTPPRIAEMIKAGAFDRKAGE
jgi:hypothetical protein